MKRYILIGTFLIFILGSISLVKTQEKGKVAMVIAPSDFQDNEYSIPKAILEKGGYRVITASLIKGEAKGMLGKRVKVDLSLSEIKIDEYEALIFVGGTGAKVYFNNPLAHSLIKEAMEKKKVIGAICIAPLILGKSGILKGKRATVFWTEANSLKRLGAIYTGESVTQEGNIITADGPKSASLFGKRILEALRGK